jgi:hypothetical protein
MPCITQRTALPFLQGIAAALQHWLVRKIDDKGIEAERDTTWKTSIPSWTK